MSYVRPIERALSDLTAPGQSESGSNGDEWGSPYLAKI